MPKHFRGPHGTRATRRILRGISSLVAVHRLREVACLYGFTRFEPAPVVTDEFEDVGLAVRAPRLPATQHWLPAVEQFGEGLFLTLDRAALQILASAA